MTSPDTTVVVPCFNEADRLDVATYLAHLAAHPEQSLLFVDDGSSDGTRKVLDDLCAQASERAAAMSLPSNQGKAEAVRVGILKALDDGATYVGFWDADLATPLDQIGDFRSILIERGELLAVLGSRVRRLGAAVERQPVRHYLGRLFATVVSLMLGMGVYDSQCGAKLFRASDETRDLFASPFLSAWIFDVEILARLVRARRQGGAGDAESALCEFPLPSWHDVAGSKLKSRHMLLALNDLLRIYRHYG